MSAAGRAGCATIPLVLAAAFLLPSGASAASQSLGTVGDFKYAKETAHLAAAGGAAEKAKDVAPRCAGHVWHISGGGAYMGGSSAHSFLSTDGFGGNRSWFASAWHFDAPSAKLTGIAVCVRHLSLVTDTDVVSVNAAPANGQGNFPCFSGSILGGGVRAIGATTDWFINGTEPFDLGDMDSEPDDAWQDYLRHRAGGSSSILIDTVCGQSVTPSYRQKVAPLDSSKSAKVRARCNSGHITGGGAVISGNIPDAHIAGSYPVDGSDKDKIPDDGWEARATNDTGSDKTLTTYAICL
jgi:hypothetical protein